MPFDPENHVVKLCAQGMMAEGAGNADEAKQLFQEAWDIAADDFEAFTAAHYLARSYDDPVLNLQWNLEALHRAQLIPTEKMQQYYPSLYLNLGKSYEQLNDRKEAHHHYQLGEEYSKYLPDGPYGNMIRAGIHAGLSRVKM